MKIDITVPDDWSEVTVQQWLDAEDVRQQDLSEMEKGRKLVAIMCELPEETVTQLTTATVADCLKHLMWMQKEIDLTQEVDAVAHFYLDGVQYGFIPDFTKLSTGEFIDLDNYTRDGWYANLPQVMSVLYRPVVRQSKPFYQIADYAPSKERAAAMREAPMHACLSAMVFFSLIGRRLAYDFAKSSQEAASR